MVERLQLFAQTRPNVVLIRLEENQGFVGAVNRAAEIAERDFVLLNTDVVVPAHWLERLFAPLLEDPKVASITPFSNAATVCSFPELCEDNAIYGGFSVDQIDKWFAHVRRERIETDLPSGVGFLMAIRRRAWLEVGAFDEVAFRRGYGEENDWCLRAKAKGYRNVIAPDLFAYHKHGGTFESSTRAELREASLNEVARRFPSYNADVERYCARDPLRPLREILSIVIACREAKEPSYLIVDHMAGGGANHYRERQVKELVARGSPVLSLHPNGSPGLEFGEVPYLLEFAFAGVKVNLNVNNLSDIGELWEFADVDNVVVNNVVSFQDPIDILKFLVEKKEKTNARLTIPIHDFYPLCPSYTLLSSEGRYCGLPDEVHCHSCLPNNVSAANPTLCAIGNWRDHWGRLLVLADEVLCFSEDSREHLLKIFPGIERQTVVRPHVLDVRFDRKPVLRRFGPLHIGVVGAIGPQKGSQVILNLAAAMQARDPHAKVTVIGMLDRIPPIENLKVTGTYKTADLPNLIEREHINVFLFPSIWPETFSFVCEELMALGVPLAVFDLGAPAERVRNYPLGRILDPALARNPDKLYEEMRRFAEESENEALPVANKERQSGPVDTDVQV